MEKEIKIQIPEVLLDCFERSGKRKSKEMQQFIDMLYEALE